VSSSSPTALSNFLRRISNEPPASDAVPEAPPSGGNGVKLFGFDEPVAAVPEPAPEPAPEDIVALLAEQPEVARLGDVEPPAAEEVATAALPQSRSEVLIAQLSTRVMPVAPRPAMSRQVPEETTQPEAAQPPLEPLVEPPPERLVEPPPLAPAPELPSAPPTDRIDRQSLSRNRRLYRRVRLGAEIEVNGSPCTLVDLSIGGFAATGIPNLAANTIVPANLRLTIDGIEVGTRLNARIIYSHRERTSGRFIDPTASQTAFLRYIVTWRGESVGTVGTTTLLDVITGGPGQGFAAKPSNGSKERWWAGLIGWKVNPQR
jgi:hypothetical protein